MQAKRDVLPALLGYVLRGQAVPKTLVQQLRWPSLLRMASRHKVLSTLACALPLMEERPEGEICTQLENVLMEQMLVSSNQLFAAQQLQQSFEQKGLFNLTLKGIHTKLRYPQDFMRSMGDLDVLYKAEQTPGVKAAMKELGYTGFQEGRKHDHYSRQPYVAVEMHRQLVSASSGFSEYYENIWQRSRFCPGCRYSHTMSVEDEYLFNLIHMVEHFKEGGVGIRFIMDVYVYETLVQMDRAYLRQELEKLELWEFYGNIVKLAMYWFDSDPAMPDGLTLELADFVRSGGVYGSAKNSQALSVSKGGRLAFLMRACFPSYREMCSMFPWLEKWPVALPAAWGFRAVRSLAYRRGNVKNQLNTYAHADAERGHQLRRFYEACGLKDL